VCQLEKQATKRYSKPEYDSAILTQIKKKISHVKKVFVDGSHSTAKELSFYDRITDRSNNPMENFNAYKNHHGRRTKDGYTMTGI